VLLKTSEVIDYYNFALNLGVPKNVLNEIKESTPDVDVARDKIISHFISNTEKPTWRTIIEALQMSGHTDLANKIYEDQYGKLWYSHESHYKTGLTCMRLHINY